MTTEAIKLLLAAFAMLVTQLWKMWKPEAAAVNAKWIAITLVIVGAVVNTVSFLAMNDPIVANNNWDAGLKVIFAVLEGASLGAVAVGLYEFGNGVNGFSSTQRLLARKHGAVTQTTIDTKTVDAETLKATGVEVSEVTVEVGNTTTKKSTKKTPK